MLTNFFSKSKPVTSVAILLLFVCFFLATFLNSTSLLKTASYLPLFLLILGVFNFINSKNSLTFDNSFAFLFFTLLFGYFHQSFAINQHTYGHLTLLLFLRKVYSLQSDKNLTLKYFDGGLWLGVSFLTVPTTVIFAPLLYVSILYHQRLTIQSFLGPIIGFFAPVFLYFTYCYWYELDNTFYSLFNWTTVTDYSLYQKLFFLIPFIAFSTITLIGVVFKTPKALAVKNSFRINWLLLLFNLAIAIILVLLIQQKDGSELIYLFFPTAIIIANLIEILQKKWLKEIILSLFIVGAFIMLFI